MINKTKTYLVLNYNGSRVAVNTRNESFIIPGGTEDEPGSYPFSIDEITQINAGSQIFKIGVLRFEPQFEADIYEELRIRNWENILRNEEIEQIILHPTLEGLQRIVDIDNDMYFERVYGTYVGLKNANYAIPGNSKTVIEAKNKEMKAGRYRSAIKLKKAEENKIDPEVEALKEQVKRLEAMLAKTAPAPVEDKPKTTGRGRSTKKPQSTKAK